MFASIWDDVKKQFSYGNMVTRIILVNVGAFILINLLMIFGGGFRDPIIKDQILGFFAVSKDLWTDLTRPWVLITHMFTHVGFFHILFNMILLYWFGRIFGDLLGDRRVLPLYLLGGLFGMFCFIAFASFFYQGGAIAYGASAAVMAVVVATGFIAPDYLLHLILIGEVKLKYVVGVLVLIDIIGVNGAVNTGGHAAHLGGAIFGWLFIAQLRNGQDMAAPVNKFLDQLTDFFRGLSGKRRRGPKVAYRNPKRNTGGRRARGEAVRDQERGADSSHQEQLDAILDKIKSSGYESLTEEEKEFLFNASKK